MRFENFKQKTKAFIETGSYIGLGIDLAIRSGFETIYSIELAEHYYNECKAKFKNDDRVNLILGDSYYKLEELLNDNPNTQFTYWLDGHYSGGDTGFGVKETPLMKELGIILSRPILGELIYIDDMRLYRDFNEEVNFKNIVDIVKEYKPNAIVWFEPSNWDSEDIMVIDY
jgi:hypothetical protein